MPVERTPYYAAYRRLFARRETAGHPLTGFVPGEWADELDLSTLARSPGGPVSEEPRQRRQDRVWRAHR